MQSVESICCHWKLKEFKDLKVALQALPILMLQFTVFCYVMFHVISHVMYSQCLLLVVEMHSPLAHYSHSGLTSHGSAVSILIWPESTFYAESISTLDFCVLSNTSCVWSYSPIWSFAECLFLEDGVVFVCCFSGCPLSLCAGAIIRTDTGTETIIPID